MAITHALRPGVAAAAALLLAACSSTGSVTEATGTGAAAPSAAASTTTAGAATSSEGLSSTAPSTTAPSTTGTDPGATGTTAGPGGASTAPGPSTDVAVAEADPCTLLDAAGVQDVLGVEVDAGVEDRDEARQVRMCTWQNSDPVVIVVAGVTSVGADEAYTTNKDLAPAYFDGTAVEKPVAGADRAYVVKSGDTGYAVGLVARGRYLSVQVAADGVTEEQAVTLAERAAAALPAG